ncbi:MAG TPA: hypothetical protein VLM80_11200 [Anaerolineales bacterium]|nr:hypothetical protein [Anaerolineales bacterium]
MMKHYLIFTALLFTLFSAGCSLVRPQATQQGLVFTPQASEIPDENQVGESTQETMATLVVDPEIQGAPQATATFNPTLSNLTVIYLKDGDLWRWNAPGAEQLTRSGDVYQPKLSPDGNIVAFLRPSGDFHVQLWAIDTNGENERVLVTIDDLNAIGGGVRDPNAVAIAPYEFEWIPGTQLLAFNTQQILQGPGLFLLDDFHIVDAVSLQLRMVLLAGWGGIFMVSPDGQQVVLSTPSQIALAELDGSNYRQVLVYTPVITYSDYRYYARPVWKLDSSGLWVAIPPEDPLAQPVESTSLYEISAAESTARLVNQIPAVSYIESPVVYSPDAEYLIYLKESGDPEGHLRELYISKPDGSGAWMYQRDYLLKFLNWSIDSTRFVYTVGENQTAWLGDLQAPAQELLTELNPLTQMRWIDSEHFLFARVDLDAVDLYLGNIESPPRLLAEQIDPPMVFDFHLDVP